MAKGEEVLTKFFCSAERILALGDRNDGVDSAKLLCEYVNRIKRSVYQLTGGICIRVVMEGYGRYGAKIEDKSGVVDKLLSCGFVVLCGENPTTNPYYTDDSLDAAILDGSYNTWIEDKRLPDANKSWRDLAIQMTPANTKDNLITYMSKLRSRATCIP